MEEKRKKISRPLVIFVAIIILLIVGFFLYVFVIRPQDSDYDTAVKQIDVMISEAASIKELGTNNALDSATVGALQILNDRLMAIDYNNASLTLQKSPAVTRDSKVATYYKTVQSKIVDYGQSSADMIDTAQAYASIVQSCGALQDNISSIKSASDLSTADADCKNALTHYTSAPLIDFNKNYFQSYHSDVNNWLNATIALYAASNATEVQRARSDALKALDALSTLRESNTPHLINTTNPTSELNKLKQLLIQRRSVFFR